MALTLGQIAARLLACGAAGLIVGAIACVYAFDAMFSGRGGRFEDALFPASIILLGASALAIVAGLVTGLVALARR